MDESIWDSQHGVPIYTWDSIESSMVVTDGYRGHRARHIVRAKGTPEDFLNISSLYVPGESNVLIVPLHGALVRENVTLPRFEWQAALAHRPDHLLFLADTTLDHSDVLTLAWYIGTQKDDLTRKLATYIRHVAKQLGIETIVLLGSSGGGYAAISIGTYLENSCSIAFTPQTNVWDFTPGHSKNLMNEVFPEFESQEALNDAFPERFSLLERYARLPHKNRFIYFQNSGDREHVLSHKKPFAEFLGVRLPDGRTFDQSGVFVTMYHGDGHVRPPKERLDPLIDQAIESLESPVKTPVRTAGLTGKLFDHEFNRGDSSFLRVPPELNSYYLVSNPPLRPEADNLAYTPDGVPLRIIEGKDYDHPVLQAQFMLKQINTLRRTESPEHREVLAATVRRLASYAVESRDGLYFPYNFEWNRGKQQPPWYSAMSQGQVLSAVARLYELDPRDEYLEFARKVYQSFLNLPDDQNPDAPWVVDIDSEGFLWLDEYPYPGQGKCVINGHLFAAWGLYDYWRVFGSNDALKLANAALATTKRYIWKSRNPGWSSHYDMTVFFLIRNYHQTHISQMETTYNLTGDPFFLAMADLLENDFPSYQRNGSLYLGAGSHTLFKADNTAVPTKLTDSKVLELAAAVSVNFAVRTKVETADGIWLRISQGEHENWWVNEEAGRAFPRLCLDKHHYARHRKIIVGPGMLSHHQFNQWGSPIDVQKLEITSPTVVEVKAKALWNGVWHYELAEVPGSSLAGRWVRRDTV
ncbi:D-glucuronyl C5-epimerase family protein [Pseudarthrobacter sp. HLT3-5]|uniref:D-glucuronyl C5-epimerase family protein n=1 Tax=Pseudarthrobacter cellobiosi TaxID=2953654 RepID=UPI00208EA691|nr:D-glucuronyl C5-epimerase family protein [Pseudarthrobacter sp. HLT3-5]MCO4276556.1 D-glucuronyl C5-epimerase family protein [Pseudarthrobacter sp. HLT3-5]